MLFALSALIGCSAAQSEDPRVLEQQAEGESQPAQVAAAMRDYDAVLAREPRDARALAHRAASFLLIGRSDRALVDVDNAIAIDGGTAFSFTVRALAEQNDPGGKDKAFSDATRAIDKLWQPPHERPGADSAFDVLDALDRNYAIGSAFTLRAEIRKERKQYDLALADVDAIIDRDPEETSAWAVRASIQRARAALRPHCRTTCTPCSFTSSRSWRYRGFAATTRRSARPSRRKDGAARHSRRRPTTTCST